MPDNQPAPADQPLGLDAEGAAGGDAFGLAARRGGSDLVGGTGSAPFAWYTNRITDAIRERLSSAACAKSAKGSLSIHVLWRRTAGSGRSSWRPPPAIRQSISCIDSALTSMPPMSDPPPPGMPRAGQLENRFANLSRAGSRREMNMFTAKLLRASMASLALGIAPVAACLAADERQSLEELRNTVINLLQALVDQGVITREKAEQMVKSAQDKAAADAAAAAKADEGAVRVPYVPQIVKDEIAKQVAEQVKPAVVADVVKEAKTEKWGVPGALADWLTRTRISGSVHLREEDIFYSAPNQCAKLLPELLRHQCGRRHRQGGRSTLTRMSAKIACAFAAAPVSRWIRISPIRSPPACASSTGNTSDLVSETQTLDGTAPYQFGLDELYHPAG